MVQHSNLDKVMEARDHFKNGASSKSQMSRGNFRITQMFSRFGKIAIIAITAMFIANKVNAQTTVYNQIVIFVELADTKFDYPLQQTAEVLNGSNETNISFSNYFDLASCGKIQYKNYFPMVGTDIYVVKLPWTWQDVLASYLGGNDTNAGACYNVEKIGKAAIEAVVDKLPADVNFDVNNDGVIDFLSIYVAAKNVDDNTTCPSYAGTVASGTPKINGKIVGSVAYSTWSEKDGIVKEDMAKYNLGISVHETIHTFGIDDYYYYYSTEHQTESLGTWDVMNSAQTIAYIYDTACNCWEPQWFPTFPSAYLRSKLNWINIPEITTAGRYTLYPATSGKTEDVAYKICTNADPAKKEYIVVEYRQKGDSKSLDGGIYGSGLVIYRVNANSRSNMFAAEAYYPNSVTDETLIAESESMVYRLGGTPASFGNIESSFFSADVGRTAFTPNSDPYPFLASGEKITDIYITNISSAGETISFDFSRVPTSIEKLFISTLKIYPNPIKDEVHITSAEGCTLRVFNIAGVTVHTQHITNSDETINFEHIPGGVYFFRFEKDGNEKTVKVIKN